MTTARCGPATSRPGWCPTTAHGSTTGCAATCAASTNDDEVDVVIVGAGAGGATLAQRLARAGWRTVVLDAGPFWDPDTDWVSDERGSHVLFWTEPRQIGGADPVPLGSNNSGRGVGGSMVHYAGYVPRFHPSDFHTHSADGVGADWPIDYPTLRPYYEQIEAELPVAGQDWPWGDPHSYPHSPHPVGGNGMIALRGAAALGIDMRVGPVAIPNGRFGNRPHCIYRGFCLQGCKVNAKASPLITHIPDALAHGAEIRPDSHVARVLVDDRTGRATGVEYYRAGVVHRQRAHAVVVAGYSIETPRLLLLSATNRYPDGLGNDHDNLGRYLMVQGAPQVAGRFSDEIRMYKSPPPEVSTEAFYETDPTKPYKRGWSIQTDQSAAHHLGRTRYRARTLGQDAARIHARLRALGHPGRAVRTAAPTRQPRHPGRGDGPPRPCGGPLLATASATTTTSSSRPPPTSWATFCAPPAPRRSSPSSATPTWSAGRAWPLTLATVSWTAEHRVFGVDGLYVVDGSTLPTQGSANPALTIMALAARAADLMTRHAARSEDRREAVRQ